MTVPEKRRSSNLQKSLNLFIEQNFTQPNNLSGSVNYQDSTYDSCGKTSWVDIFFINDTAGKKGELVVQFDIYTRVVGLGDDGDRYGQDAQLLADELHDALHVRDFQVYDFSVTPESPTLIDNAKLVIVNSNGTFREPEEVRHFPIEDGVKRITMTYRLRYIGDFSLADQYYD